MSDAITSFNGDNFFLSNFYVTPVFYQGIRFESSEAAFQAAKCPERMQEFCGLNPSEAKRLGRSVTLRPDWEEVKLDVMYQVCMAKFTQNPRLAEKLIATGDAELVDGNTWGDRIWGVCDGVGENNLGKILMQVRDRLRGSENYPDAVSGDVYLNPAFGDLWVVDDGKFIKINDGYFIDLDDPEGFVKVGHIDGVINKKWNEG